jgi:uncharacterized alkaline shock family protein YloU
MTDEATVRMDRTQEMYLPALVQAPIPDQGGAEVLEVAAYRGDTSVDREVVEKVAGAAARSVPGVVELGGDVARFMNRVLDKVGLDEVGDARRGVSAEVEGISVAITVILVVAAGEVISDVTSVVRSRVIEAVEHYGLQVTGVDVKVDDVRMPTV